MISLPKSLARSATTLLLTVGGLFFLTGCGPKEAAAPATPGAPKLTKIILQTDWYAQPEHGGFYQALVKGYYREAGLDVTIEPGGPNMMPLHKVARGTTQFSIGRSDDLAISVGRGLPLVMAGALMQRDPQALMFHEESGIRDFADLNGRAIMTVPGAAYISIIERKYGIKVSILPLDFGMSRFLADKNFVQQCFLTNEPFYVKREGANPGLLLLSDTGFSPYRVWFTNRDFARENPAVVRAFTAASIRGWEDYISGDRTEADRVISSLNPKMTPEFIEFSVAAMKQYKLVEGDATKGERVGRIDPARLTSDLAQLEAIGMLEKPLTPADIFDPQFLPPEVLAPAPPR